MAPESHHLIPATLCSSARSAGGWAAVALVLLLAASHAICWLPLQLVYGVPPAGNHAGPSSVCLPGGGFAGFWFHLGYLHSLEERERQREHQRGHQADPVLLHDYDYYCFSAGCLSILSAFLNRSLDEVYGAALAAQNAWKDGTHSRFDIVDHFFDSLVPPEEEFEALLHGSGDNANGNATSPHDANFLPRLKILVTTSSEGLSVMESRNRDELRENIRRTTWVPYLTGWGMLVDTGSSNSNSNSNSSNNNNNRSHDVYYLDGGFSRVLHPACGASWDLPFVWETLVHTFSPGLTRGQVESLWARGYGHGGYDLPPVPRGRAKATATTAARAPNTTSAAQGKSD